MRKLLGVALLCALSACITVDVKPRPVPTPSPVVEPSPTPVPLPSPTMSPSPVMPSPSPVPLPSPTVPPTPPPTPKPPKPNEVCKPIPKGQPGECNTCYNIIDTAVWQNNWNCPRTQGWPGREHNVVRDEVLGEIPRPPYDANKGKGMCYNNSDNPHAQDRVALNCDRYALDSDTLLNKGSDGRVSDGRPICACDPLVFPQAPPTPRPSPTPQPSPTGAPTPRPSPTASPTGDNFPLPPHVDVCTPEYTAVPIRVGVATLGEGRACSGNCQKDGYLGWIINVSATPHDQPPRCGHRPTQRTCEQWPGCQLDHSDPSNPGGGPVIVMKNAAWGDRWELVDKRSDNNYNAHHKPRQGETGPTIFKSCYPGWDLDNDSRCGTITLNVHADGKFTFMSRTAVKRMVPKRGAKPKLPTKWEEDER